MVGWPLHTSRLAFLALVALCGITAAGTLQRRPVSADTTPTSSCSVDLTHLALDSEEQAVLDQMNVYRASNGLPALRSDYALTQNALWKSTDLATYAYFTHDDLFRTVQQRFTDCGYDISAYYGENLAAGDPSGAGTLVQWQSSPQHKTNLLDPRYTAVGIKRARSTNPTNRYGWYWAMEFGNAPDADLSAGLAGQ